MVFEDVTWESVNTLNRAKGSEHKGLAGHAGQAYLREKLPKWLAGITDMSFQVKSRFNSGGLIASVIRVTATMDSKVDGVAPMTSIANGVIVLQIQDGKVVHHQDYFDYENENPRCGRCRNASKRSRRNFPR